MPKEKNGPKIIAQNKKAYHDYFVDDEYEAGIELRGTEVKSVRLGRINLKDSYVSLKSGEALLIGAHISPYDRGNMWNCDPERPRRLLLHKREISRLIGLTARQGYTLIPLKVYFSRQYVKVLLGLCRGKKIYDKREDMAKQDALRHMERAVKNYGR